MDLEVYYIKAEPSIGTIIFLILGAISLIMRLIKKNNTSETPSSFDEYIPPVQNQPKPSFADEYDDDWNEPEIKKEVVAQRTTHAHPTSPYVQKENPYIKHNSLKDDYRIDRVIEKSGGDFRQAVSTIQQEKAKKKAMVSTGEVSTRYTHSTRSIVKDMFKHPDDIKKAIIMSEILNRKY